MSKLHQTSKKNDFQSLNLDYFCDDIFFCDKQSISLCPSALFLYIH
jgi:hypothetical protein